MLKKLFGIGKKKDKKEKLEDKISEEISNDKEEYEKKVKEIKEETSELLKDKDESNLKEIKEEFESIEKNIDDRLTEDLNSIKEEYKEISTENKQEDFINTVEIVNEELKKDYKNIDDNKSEDKKKPGLIERLKQGLTKTRDAVSSSIDNLINGKAKIDDDLYEELEEIMISADMGVETTINIIDELRDTIEEKRIREPKFIKEELEIIMKNKLRENNFNNELNINNKNQTVILVIGVNGVGKTTTIGKLAHNIKNEGSTVVLAAADTFRAAAIEQLTEWSERAQVDIVAHNEGSDPASVVYDAIQSQKSKGTDVLICDTAGRLHNKKNLMNELEKINRVIDREHPDANRETLLVLDATTGQNAIHQAKEFNKVTDITGIVLTKLDGTAKGGVVFPLQVENKIPVKYIGIGEQIDNLEKFDSDKFVEALLG